MWFLLVLGYVGIVAAQTSIGPIDCSDKDDGFAFWGCKAFHRCERGVPRFIECGPSEVFDEETGGCNSVDRVRTPCGMDLRDRCRGVNGPYSRGVSVRDYQEPPNFSNRGIPLRCTYFNVCYQGTNYGTQKCSGGNVFDDSQQSCVDPGTISGECSLQFDDPRRG